MDTYLLTYVPSSIIKSEHQRATIRDDDDDDGERGMYDHVYVLR